MAFVFMFAFSTCWNSQRNTDGRAMLAEVRALGFEYAELGHATRLSLLDGIQKAVAAGEIRIASLHNFCPLPLGLNGPAPDYYMPSSMSVRERQNAVRHTTRTIDCAAALGAKCVVMHCGMVGMRGYTMKLLDVFAKKGASHPKFQRVREKALAVRAKKRQKYLDNVAGVLDLLVPRAKEMGIKLGLETRLGVEEIPDADETAELLAKFDADTVGYWHDVGHAQMKEQFGLTTHETLLERFRGRTFGMHLQDFIPPAGDHVAPGQGTFDFGRLAPFVTGDMVLAWEIHREWSAEQIVAGAKPVHEKLHPVVNT